MIFIAGRPAFFCVKIGIPTALDCLLSTWPEARELGRGVLSWQGA
jgi:hypothetical protein